VIFRYRQPDLPVTVQVLTKRAQILSAAFAQYPNRFVK